MNIVEAYLKFKGKMIILISGLAGTDKGKIAKDLATLLKFDVKSLREFILENYKTETVMSNGEKFINFDHVDAYDWEKLNTTLDSKSSNGIIMYGFAFPTDKLTVRVDYHVNIKLSKQNYIKNRHKYLKSHKESKEELFKLIETPTESIMINKHIFPDYLEYTKNSIINKFLNGNERKDEEVFNELFDWLMEGIGKTVNDKNTKPYGATGGDSSDNVDSDSDKKQDEKGFDPIDAINKKFAFDSGDITSKTSNFDPLKAIDDVDQCDIKENPKTDKIDPLSLPGNYDKENEAFEFFVMPKHGFKTNEEFEKDSIKIPNDYDASSSSSEQQEEPYIIGTYNY